MIAALADKRCQNFGTCGAAGTATTGTAKVNIEFFALSARARDYLYGGRCSLVRPVVTEVVKQMAVPLLQGTLRYAYKVATNGPSGSNTNAAGSNTLLKENAEGAIFAHAVLPMIHKVSASAATTVYTNMKIGSFSPDKAAVKSAIESVLPGMGLTCADIGALTAASSEAFGTCNYPSPSSPSPSPSPSPTTTTTTSTGLVIVVIIAGVVAALFALIIIYMYCQEKAGKPVFTTLSDVKKGTV